MMCVQAVNNKREMSSHKTSKEDSMTTLQLSTNGPKFNLPHSTLVEIAGDIAHHAATQQELFRALLDLNVPSITEALADHVDVDEITIEDADRMWQQGMCEARHSILRDDTFLQRITWQQWEDMLRMDDTRLFATVAENFDFGGQEQNRLNKDQTKRLHDFLKANPDRGVQKALLENDSLEDEWENVPLSQRIALDAVRIDDYANLSLEDVELFRHADNETLQSLSYNVDEIEDRRVRKAITQMFMEHADPKFRQEMALASNMPRDVLKQLTKCDDPIAAAYAMMTLEDLEDMDE